MKVNRCPLTGELVPNHMVFACTINGSPDICAACRAGRPLWARAVNWLRQWLQRLMVGLVAGLLLFGSAAAPVAADPPHNPMHDPAAGLGASIRSGQRGGIAQYSTPDGRYAWTDGSYVYVEDGQGGSSYFKSRNAVDYLRKDAARHGATLSTASRATRALNAAKGLAGASGSGLLGSWSIWVGCQAAPYTGFCPQPTYWR